MRALVLSLKVSELIFLLLTQVLGHDRDRFYELNRDQILRNNIPLLDQLHCKEKKKRKNATQDLFLKVAVDRLTQNR